MPKAATKEIRKKLNHYSRRMAKVKESSKELDEYFKEQDEKLKKGE